MCNFLKNLKPVILVAAISPFVFACGAASGSEQPVTALAASSAAIVADVKPSENATAPVDSSAVSILARKQIPILCYHQIRPYKENDSPTAKQYIVPPAAFHDQMRALHDSGYTTILPDQLVQYLLTGVGLPDKSVLISFDDGCDEQFDVTKEILAPYGMKAAYFIMTVAINRPNYMKAEQIKELSDAGHTIGLHTWDHHNVKKYAGPDWVQQIEKPKAALEKITGKPVQYFAYPFGLWNQEAIPELQQRGLHASFILSTTRDQQYPMHTIRRIIVPGTWSGTQLLTRMKAGF